MRQVFRGDAGTGVADFDSRKRLYLFKFDPELTAIRHRLQTVFQQIEQQLNNTVRDNHNLQSRVRCVADLNPGRFGLDLYQHNTVPDQHFQISRLPFATILTGKGEQVIYQRFHTERLGHNPVRIMARLIQCCGGFHKLGKAFDTGQRVADLVRHNRPHHTETRQFFLSRQLTLAFFVTPQQIHNSKGNEPKGDSQKSDNRHAGLRPPDNPVRTERM